MSDEHKDFYYQGGSTMYSSSSNYDSSSSQANFDPISYMSLSESLQLGASIDNYNSFALSPSSLDLFPSPDHHHHQANNSNITLKSPEDGDLGGGGGETPVTQNSSLSSSSSEAMGDQDSGKTNIEDQSQVKGEETSKKGKKGNNKKGEKKEKELRFAFMTKSEVDQLEDGYRWRKYGQKAVKNSPYPRSYYRCTTQKCNVKKRVERSFEDPTTVITTYEGQHNHPVPTSLRATYNVAAPIMPDFFSPPSSSLYNSSNNFISQDNYFLNLLHHNYNNYSQNYANPNSLQYHHPDPNNHQLHYRPNNNGISHDYGLLQDVVPSSMFLKQEPQEQ